MLRLWQLTILISFSALVLADTEIRNFHLPLAGEPVLPTGPVSVITAHPRLNTFVLSRAEPELWVELDTGADSGGWTARISWAASTPTRFEMDVLRGSMGGSGMEVDGESERRSGERDSKESTARTLLHIRAKALSPRMPHPLLARFGWTPPTLTDADFETPFHLVLEPLILGIVPRTTVSAIGAVVVMVLAAVACVPFAIRFVEGWAARVKEEEQKEMKTQ